MGRKIRRVVTGHDENGVATVIMDGDADCILQRPNRPGVTLTNLWQNTKTPAAMERHDDPVTGTLILHPPKNGSVFRIFQFDPENPDELAKLDGKAAQTRFTRLSYDSASNTSWLDVEILTGRTHQIRRHLDRIQHPVMGDPKYGKGNKNKLGLQLFAVKLAFTCPTTRELKTFELSREFLESHCSIAE